jgi:hypothetical protein
MELIPGSETSTHFNQTPGLYPKEILYINNMAKVLKLKKKDLFSIPYCDEGFLTGLP